MLDTVSHRAKRGEKEIEFTAKEYALLEYLMRNAGRVLTRSMLLQHVWNYDFDGNDNVLDVYISYLRKKLDRGTNGSVIQTVRGIGYKLGGADA